MTTTIDYVQISENEIPAGVRFDAPGNNAGQIVIRAYGGFSKGEHDRGSEYMSKHDQSTGETTYYRLSK